MPGKKSKALVHAEFKKEELHETRKQLKEFLYNFKLSFPQTNKLVRGTDQLQDLIGKWHDNDIAIGHLTRVIQSGKLTRHQLSGFRKVLQAILYENKKLFERIDQSRERLSEFVNI